MSDRIPALRPQDRGQSHQHTRQVRVEPISTRVVAGVWTPPPHMQAPRLKTKNKLRVRTRCTDALVITVTEFGKKEGDRKLIRTTKKATKNESPATKT